MSGPGPVDDRVEWHEGMLLAPQHFQLASARLDSLLAWQQLHVAPFGWGVINFRIATNLLSARILRVVELDAILPDGTAVSYHADNALHGSLELPLEPVEKAMANGPLDVYLQLPLNRSMRDKGKPRRFRSVACPPLEDEVSDALPADVPRLLPNLSLAAGAVPAGLYTWLRLCTVSKDNEVIKRGDELPPLLVVPKDGKFWERLTRFVGDLRDKAAFLAKQTAVPSSRTEDRLAYLEQRERLSNLMVGLPLVEAVLRTPRLHPYSLFLALCGLLGPICMLRPGGMPPEPPEYDHANPLSSLLPVIDALEDSLQEVSQDYLEHKFEFRHGAFEIVLRPEWIGMRLVLGLRGQLEGDLIRWMADAIIGSQSAYVSLRDNRVPGAARAHIEKADELGVRASSGYTLFEVQTTTALTVPNEPLVVSNSTESAAGQRPNEMVLFVKG